MPLMPGKSKKAFSKNVGTEMNAGKPQKQALAIAYSVQRKNKKKAMYDGGEVLNADETGSNSDTMLRGRKPMGQEEINFKSNKRADADDASDSRDMNELDDASTMGPEELDLRKEHMVGENDKNEREMKMLDSKPLMHKSEIRAASSRPSSDNSKDSLDEMMMAEGGEINFDDEMEADADNARDARDMAMMKKGYMMAKGGQAMYAEGGDVTPAPKSIAEAIMRKRKSSAMDSESDLNRNADEDLNYEDQLSFQSGRKQSYSEEAGLDKMGSPEDSNEHGRDLPDEDENDMVSILRKKMKSKRMME